jgi:hypothetical protein
MPGSTAHGGPYSGSSSPDVASASASTPPLSAEKPICALAPSCARALLATGTAARHMDTAKNER